MLSLELAKNENGKYDLESCLANFTKVENLDTDKENTVNTKRLNFGVYPEF